MPATVTLAHLTDVHLAPITGFTPRYWDIKRALGYANWVRGRRRVHQRWALDAIVTDMRSQHPDHIFVTGDLANLGLPGEYQAAARWLQQVGDPERVSVIPGNHDIYTILRHGPSCLEVWQPYMRSDPFGARVLSDDWEFPFVRRIGPVALIALNSAVATPPFVAAGQLGDRQRERLVSVLRHPLITDLIRLVLIHHPPVPGQAPRRRALRDAGEVERILIQHGADLVVHGHNHTESLVWLPSQERPIPIVGGASASAAHRHKDEPMARYHLLRLTRTDQGREIEVIVRGLDGDGRGVRELSRRVLIPDEVYPAT